MMVASQIRICMCVRVRTYWSLYVRLLAIRCCRLERTPRRERERKEQTEQEREEKYRVRICGLVCESRGHLLFVMCLPMTVTMTCVLLSKAKMPDTFVQ